MAAIKCYQNVQFDGGADLEYPRVHNVAGSSNLPSDAKIGTMAWNTDDNCLYVCYATSPTVVWKKLGVGGAVVEEDGTASGVKVTAGTANADSVVTYKIKAYDIKDAHIASGAAITWSKLKAGTASSVMVTNSSGVPTTVSQLPVTQGGIGASSLTANRLLLGNGTSPISVLGQGSNNYVLVGRGTSAPAWVALSTIMPTLTLDDVGDGTTRKLANYLPLAGGTMTGSLKWQSTALPAITSPQYILAIDAFADGGATKYVNIANLGTAIGLGNYLPLAGLKTVSGLTTFSAGLTVSGGNLTVKTLSGALYGDSGVVKASSTTATELGYVHGVTSAIQTQLDDKVTRYRVYNRGTNTPWNGSIPLWILSLKNGYPLYTDTEFETGTNSISRYRTTATVSRVLATSEEGIASAESGTGVGSSSYVLKVVATGEAGFVQSIASKENKVFVQIFRAWLPVGYKFVPASNSTGDGRKEVFLTDEIGTGKWEWYVRTSYCGVGGTFSSTGYIYITRVSSDYDLPSAENPVTFYLAECNAYDITRGSYAGLRVRYADSADSSAGVTVTNDNNSTLYFTGVKSTDGTELFNTSGVTAKGTALSAGSVSVTGLLESDTGIQINSNNEDKYITFNYTQGERYDWRIGYIGTGDGDANYFTIEGNSNTGTFTRALQIGATSFNSTFAGSILPIGNNSKDIGSSSAKWANVYATKFNGEATNVTTTEDTSNALYVVGVTSGATTALKRDTSVTVTGGTLNATTLVGTTVKVGGSSGAILKYADSALQVRNSADSDWGAVKVGNLTVEGTITYINTQDLNVADNIITLNSDVTGAPSENAGIEIERGTSTNASLLWDESNDVWKAGLVGSEKTLAFADLSNVSGTLTVAHGGTGVTSLTANRLLVGNGTSAIGVVGVGTTDYVLVGAGNTVPVWKAKAPKASEADSAGQVSIGSSTGKLYVLGVTTVAATAGDKTVYGDASVYVQGGTVGATTFSGNLSGGTISGTTLTASSTVTFSGLGTVAGIVHNNASGVLSSSLVNLASEVSGTLPIGNLPMGTGATQVALGNHKHAAGDITSGTLSVEHGGIGTGTLTGVAVGNGTSNFTAVAGSGSTITFLSWTGTGYTFQTVPSAGSVAWANVTDKPATATRWPAWSEVTGKPNLVPYDLTTTRAIVDTAGEYPHFYNLENDTLISGYGKYYYLVNLGKYQASSTLFSSQIAMPYQSSIIDSDMFIRTATGVATNPWRDWRRVLHDNNYTTYTVQKDGTGATGTWPINVYHDKVVLDTSNLYYTHNSLCLLDRNHHRLTRGNKLAFIEPEAISIQYSTDGGETWTDAGYTDAQKANLFNGLNNASIRVGPSTGTVDVTTDFRTRIEVVRPVSVGGAARVFTLDQLFIQFQTRHTCYVDMSYTKYNAQDTFTEVFSDKRVAGNAGPNMISFPAISCWSTGSYLYLMRLDFRVGGISTNTSYLQTVPTIKGICGYGSNLITSANKMMSYDSLYSWDNNQTAIFQAGLSVPSGVITGMQNQYTDSANTGALNLNNSDIYGVNSIKFADKSDGPAEGLQWYRGTDKVDSVWVKDGVMYITPNRAYGSTTETSYTFLTTGNWSSTITMNSLGVPSWAQSATKPSYTLDEVGDGSTRKLANYLPLAGGTMTGSITFPNASSAVNSQGPKWTLGSKIGENASGAIGVYGIGTVLIRPGTGTEISTSYGLSIGTSAFTYNGNEVLTAGNYTTYVKNGTLNLQASGTNVATFTANQSGASTFNIATGSTNGTISVGGTDVAVKGLGSNAYTSTSYLPLGGGTVTGASTFSGGLTVSALTISGLGSGVVRSSGGSIGTGAINLASSDVTGTLAVENGGIGTSTVTGVLVGAGTGAVSGVSTTTANHVLIKTSTGYGFGAVPSHTHSYAGSSSAGGSATTVVSSASTSNTDYYITGVTAANGAQYYSTSVKFNASTKKITATGFVGGLEGTATNATNASVTGIVTTGTGSSTVYYLTGVQTFGTAGTAANRPIKSTNLVTWTGAGALSAVSLTLSGLGSGVVRASSGALSVGSVNLASEVSGILPVANGGIGISSISAYAIPYASAANTFGTISIGSTAGYVLAINSSKNGYEWVSRLSSVSTTANYSWSGTHTFTSSKIKIGTTGTGIVTASSGALSILTIASTDAGKVLKVNSSGNGFEWGTASSGASSLSELSDTTISSPASYQLLYYKNSTDKWTQLTAPSTNNTYLKYTTSGGLAWATITTGSTTLSGLTDTTISNPANNQILYYYGGKWTQLTAPSSANTYLKYDGSSLGWAAVSGGGGATTLSGLSDVSLSNVAQGDLLWNKVVAGDNVWTNLAGAGTDGYILKTGVSSGVKTLSWTDTAPKAASATTLYTTARSNTNTTMNYLVGANNYSSTGNKTCYTGGGGYHYFKGNGELGTKTLKISDFGSTLGVLYNSTSGIVSNLSGGLAGQVLGVNSEGDGLEWVPPGVFKSMLVDCTGSGTTEVTLQAGNAYLFYTSSTGKTEVTVYLPTTYSGIIILIVPNTQRANGTDMKIKFSSNPISSMSLYDLSVWTNPPDGNNHYTSAHTIDTRGFLGRNIILVGNPTGSYAGWYGILT